MTQQSKPKVMHVIGHMQKGGAERQLRILLDGSKREHVVLTLQGNERPTKHPVELLTDLRNPFSVAKFVYRAIEKHRINIVQLWVPDRMTVPAMIAASIQNCIIISGDRRKPRKFFNGGFRDRTYYLNHIMADIVVPNYPQVIKRASLKRTLRLPSKTLVIPNGFETQIHEAKYSKKPKRLLFVGRLVPQKNILQLIHLMPRILSETNIVGLDIVGDGELMNCCRSAIADRSLESAIVMHGPLYSWSGQFSNEDYFLVLPSTSEGMPNIIFEGIASGFFPIVSRSPEINLMFKRWEVRPLMFDPRNEEAIVQAVQQATSIPVVETQERVRAMQRGMAEFTASRMINAYDRLYDNLLAQKK